MKFEKPSLSVPDQIERLKRRGMLIPDDGKAAHDLSHISYYRLCSYWPPFEDVPSPVTADHVANPLAKPEAMGFPPQWHTSPFWRVAS